MASILVAAGARPVAKPFKPPVGFAPADAFDAFAADVIDDVALFDPPRFLLSMAIPKRAVGFGFEGKTVGEYEGIEDCEQAIEFSIIAHANEIGTIKVGVCRRQAKRARELASKAATAESAVDTLAEMNKDKTGDLRKALGGSYARSRGPDGSERHYVPIVVIGHGLLPFPTVVVVGPKGDRAAIVQLDTSHLCDHRPKIRTPLCDDTQNALTEIAARVLAH
jgi:hypothetical protein